MAKTSRRATAPSPLAALILASEEQMRREARAAGPVKLLEVEAQLSAKYHAMAENNRTQAMALLKPLAAERGIENNPDWCLYLALELALESGALGSKGKGAPRKWDTRGYALLYYRVFIQRMKIAEERGIPYSDVSEADACERLAATGAYASKKGNGRDEAGLATGKMSGHSLHTRYSRVPVEAKQMVLDWLNDDELRGQ